MQAAYEEASEKIKTYFRQRSTETARSEIEQWKAEDVYPYRDEPKTPVERAERQVFEIVPDDKLEALLTDPEGKKTGTRLRTLAERLGIQEKDFATVKAKAGSGLKALIAQAAMGAWDTIYHHELRAALPQQPGAGGVRGRGREPPAPAREVG